METLGDRILILRKLKKMTQNELGELVGKDGTTLGRYEKNILPVPSDVLLILIEHFSVSANWLLVGESANMSINTSTHAGNHESNELLVLWNELNDNDRNDTKEFMSYKISKYKKMELSSSKNGKSLTATTEDIA